MSGFTNKVKGLGALLGILLFTRVAVAGESYRDLGDLGDESPAISAQEEAQDALKLFFFEITHFIERVPRDDNSMRDESQRLSELHEIKIIFDELDSVHPDDLRLAAPTAAINAYYDHQDQHKRARILWAMTKISARVFANLHGPRARLVAQIVAQEYFNFFVSVVQEAQSSAQYRAYAVRCLAEFIIYAGPKYFAHERYAIEKMLSEARQPLVKNALISLASLFVPKQEAATFFYNLNRAYQNARDWRAKRLLLKPYEDANRWIFAAVTDSDVPFYSGQLENEFVYSAMVDLPEINHEPENVVGRILKINFKTADGRRLPFIESRLPFSGFHAVPSRVELDPRYLTVTASLLKQSENLSRVDPWALKRALREAKSWFNDTKTRH